MQHRIRFARLESLRAAEEAWIAEDFPMDTVTLAKIAEAALASD